MTETKGMSRRSFLKYAGAAVGVSVFACAGGAVLAVQTPDIEFIETNFGGNNEMGKRVLVAYASKAGSTGGVAEAIGKRLNGNGTAVDVKLVSDKLDLSQYQAVVVGSAIRMGQWLPDAKKFVEKHQAALGQMPTAYFTVCMTLEDDTEEHRREVAAYTDPIRQIMEPDSEAFFAGGYDPKKVSFLERLIMKGLKVPEGDFRQWDQINGWADSLRPLMVEA